MEPGIYLIALVFAVAALHLIDRAVIYFSSFRSTSGKRPNESGKAIPHRNDWYLFFHCSDLTGKPEKKIKNKQENKKINSSQKKYPRRDSRPALRRHFI